MKTTILLTVHGVSISQRVDSQGQTLGYFVSSYEEDLGTLQEAVDAACGLFCLEQGIVDENGDPKVQCLFEPNHVV